MWHITETEESLLSLLANQAYHVEQLEARQHPKRRVEYLATRLLIQEMYPEASTQITYLLNGRPVLPDGMGFISLSHTAGYAAAIVHPSQAVAIDIEQQGPKAARLSERFVREDERQYIAATQQEQVSTLVWSAKESLFKIAQKQDIDFKEHLHLHLQASLSKSGSMQASVHKDLCVRDYRVFYQLEPAYVLTYIIA